MIRALTMGAVIGAFCMLASCKTSESGAAFVQSADIDLPHGAKYCFHKAVRTALSTAVRDFSKKEVKDWDDAKAGGVAIDFDVDKIKDDDNGDVHRKLKDKGDFNETGGGTMIHANYKIKVVYASDNRNIKVSANFDTADCKKIEVDSDPKGDRSDDEFDDYGKCSVSAMRELIAWGIRNEVSDKDIDSWQKSRGKELVKVTKMKRESGQDGLVYRGKVEGSHGDKDVAVEFGQDCRVKDISKELPDIDDTGI